VQRPPGLRLDSGGIAKGLFADMLGIRLRDLDVFAIDCSGDILIGGRARAPRRVRVDDPFGHAVLSPASAGADPFAGLAKIAAIGVKVSRHRAYHGVALNVAMDLRPFERIDPCGHAGLRTIDLSTIGVRATWDEVASTLGAKLANHLSPR